MVWLKTGKIAKKPKLTDPLQLYSLAEVASTKGTGAEAILTCKVVDTFYDQPMNFLPQGRRTTTCRGSWTTSSSVRRSRPIRTWQRR